VAAVIYRAREKSSEIAIFRRGPEQTGAGHWEFPGGKVEVGESDSQALRREIEEELGVRIQVGDYLGENTHQYPTKKIHLKFYAVPFPQQEFVLTEHDEMRWVKLENLDVETLSEADRPLIEILKLDPRFKS
jgi:8-oxo-dGTP diphosphatase